MENTSNYAGIKDTEKKRRAVANALIYAGLGLWAVLVIFPFYWMILTSFKSYASYNAE